MHHIFSFICFFLVSAVSADATKRQLDLAPVNQGGSKKSKNSEIDLDNYLDSSNPAKVYEIPPDLTLQVSQLKDYVRIRGLGMNPNPYVRWAKRKEDQEPIHLRILDYTPTPEKIFYELPAELFKLPRFC